VSTRSFNSVASLTSAFSQSIEESDAAVTCCMR
jgi:hypothetical protein